MRERLRDITTMLSVGLRIDRRLTISLITLSLLTNLTGTLRALWFGLLVDAVVNGNSDTAVVWAIVLAVSDAIRSWALVGSQMDRQDLHDRALQHFQEEAMRLAGTLPGIEHHEHPEHVDRLAAYRGSFSALSSALGTWSTRSPTPCGPRSPSRYSRHCTPHCSPYRPSRCHH
jgi:ATP-binding cassette, subfamily B, bacterial